MAAVFVPAALGGEKLAPDAHTLIFLLSVFAIVPLAALLSHATESVAAKTGAVREGTDPERENEGRRAVA